ncbi:MAG: hypothetical protein AAGC67_00560 [Myxococcota bacterium]
MTETHSTQKTRMPRPTRKTGALLLTLLATTLLLAGPSMANPRVKPGGEALGMIGYVIDDIDPRIGSITVSGQIHFVTEASRLLDASGGRVRLRDLRGMDSHGVADMVKLTTRRSGAGGRSEVQELRVVDLGRP